MCKAKKHLENLLKVYEGIEKDNEEYFHNLSQLNLLQEDILHKLENENFNACTGFLYAKALKEIRIKRRIIKNELEVLQSLKTQIHKDMKSAQEINRIITNVENKIDYKTQNSIYNPRVLVDNISYADILSAINN